MKTATVTAVMDSAKAPAVKPGAVIARIDPRYFRPAEVDFLQGDASKGRRILGWEPKTDIRTLAAMMIDSDLKLAQREQVLREAGHAEASRLGYR